MDENKCCENYASSYAKDMDSFCVREFLHDLAVCDKAIDHHVRIINDWTKITPENVKELSKFKERLCVAFKYIENKEKASYMCGSFGIPLAAMAKEGGFFYYVLPELKME